MQELTTKENCMLFSKQCCHKSYKYRLYFVYLPSLFTDTPRIHRFVVKNRSVFFRFTPGNVYTLYYNRIILKDAELEESYPLTDEEYAGLMELRDIIFPCDDVLDELSLTGDMTFFEKYYSFSEYKKLLSYKTTQSESLATVLINWAFNALSVLIPAAMFILYITSILSLTSASIGSSDVLAVPLVIVLAFPFIIFLITLLFTLSNACLYRLDYTKWVLIKRFLLKYGGYRNNFFITRNQRNNLIRFGIISGVIFIGSLILTTVLF